VSIPDASFLDLWSRTVSGKETRPALLAVDGSCLRTLGDLEAGRREWARRLRPYAGKVIALDLPNGPDFVEVLFGIWSVDACALLLSGGLPDPLVRYAEEKAGASARVKLSGNGVVFQPDPGVSMPGLSRPWPGTCVIKMTSGSSGAPKLLPFLWPTLLADVRNLVSGMGIRLEDRNFGVLPWSHSYGLSSLIMPLVVLGSPLIFATDRMPRALADGIARTGATIFPGVPALFSAWAGIGIPAPASLRLCISAGAILSSRVAISFRKASGLLIHSFYGASECGGMLYDREGEGSLAFDGYVGNPLPGVHCEFMAVEEGSWQLEVSGAAVPEMSDTPDLNHSSNARGRYRPPDLMEKSGDGWRITGRISEWINIGGRKVNPLTVESAVLECDQMEAVLVGGVRIGGEREVICAACVGAARTPAQLRGELSGKIPEWAMPREVIFVKSIPVDERGKRNRKQLIHEWFGGLSGVQRAENSSPASSRYEP